MSARVDYRRADDLQAITAAAPAEPRRKVELLRRLASDRKVLLLDCAIVRHAPFSAEALTIWELLPEFTWFTLDLTSDRHATPHTTTITAHDAIETVERLLTRR